MTTIHTIGYEGTDQEAFVHALITHGIQHLIDVRDRPISRKRGFSKNKLKASLADAGIRYTHIQALGDPKPGREAARSGLIAIFRAVYTQHLATGEAQAGLADAMRIAKGESSALMCFERDPEVCHRLLVVNRMKALDSFTVNHIHVPSVPKALPHGRQRAACAVR